MSVRSTTVALLATVAVALVATSCADPTVPVSTPVRPAGPPPTADIAYGAEPHQRLDVLLPSGRPNGRVIVYLHGGGWSGGDKTDPLPRVFRDRLEAGDTIVAANYRYATEAAWPAQVTDAKSVVRWVRANLDAWGVDVASVVIGGWSAGGHIAIVAALSAGWWEPGPGPTRTLVDGVIGYQPVVDLSGLAAIVTANGPTDPAWGLFGGTPTAASIAALGTEPWVSGDDPPMYLIAGGEDWIAPVEPMRRLGDAADWAHGGPGRGATVELVPGAGHGTDVTTDRIAIAAFLDRVAEEADRRPVQ